MSSLAAAALRRAVTASGSRTLSISWAFSTVSSRLFSADAAAAEAGSQGDDSFLKPCDAGSSPLPVLLLGAPSRVLAVLLEGFRVYCCEHEMLERQAFGM
jgi:hypothetical protein